MITSERNRRLGWYQYNGHIWSSKLSVWRPAHVCMGGARGEWAGVGVGVSWHSIRIHVDPTAVPCTSEPRYNTPPSLFNKYLCLRPEWAHSSGFLPVCLLATGRYGLRDWSLITGSGGGGYKMGGGGTWSFTPTKRGGGKRFSLAEGGGGHNKFWGSFLHGRLKFKPYCRGGAKSVHSLKGGGARKVLPCLEGGGAQKVSDPRFSHFVAPPPLPVISDQSLTMIGARRYVNWCSVVPW